MTAFELFLGLIFQIAFGFAFFVAAISFGLWIGRANFMPEQE